ncbi:Polyketide cyclase / dehydrase and lipid transport [Amycolatopsis pretoriensis]|uniref:Polyketide cyclase / dehydrase and lipid transport n=1 Tax=Amycolatopsis pretoriensis TaxID=218821 RepID=A0A1H5QC54_9PSEU|nr:SRPBCC family protein [Amycolatopsis pretoriensis]SEF23692.1 Polyketide cyclase / dehydrase and lipid transport [Amycolatopsis pretoriensis]
MLNALFAVPLAAAALFVAAPAEAVTASPLTCRGQGIDPAAQLHYGAETFVKAPLDTVWKVQTRIEGWPAWQSAVTSAKRLDPGPLHPAARFRWTTPVPATPSSPATTLVITSTVHQVQRDHCVRWSGPAIGEGLRIDRGVHVWTFTPARGGVVVRTEESWTGAQIEADPATAVKYLAPGLDRWLADLKTAAEAAC